MKKQSVNPKVKLNLENVPFTEYYNNLKQEPKTEENNPLTPLDEFLITAAEFTGKHPGSIRRWAYGTAKPNFLEKKAMGELLQCSPEILFPN